MKNLDISDKDFADVKTILRQFLKKSGTRVYAFGSRVHGMARRYSDLDVAIDFGGSVLPIDILFAMQEAFNESNIEMRVDISDINKVSENFQRVIKPDLMEINYNE